MTDAVTSSSNPRLRLVRKLADRRGRLRAGAFAVEGEDLVVAGLAAGWQPQFVLWDASAELPDLLRHRIPPGTVFTVEHALMRDLSELGHSARIIGVFELPDVVFEPRMDAQSGPALYLDGIADPGNVGTILRSCAAFGVERIGLGPRTADPFSPKATRASMGAIFSAPLHDVDSFATFAASDQLCVALDPRADVALWEIELGSAPILCIGSERHGLSDAVREHVTVTASIPQMEGTDSVNAAVSASIALYEWRRQQG